MVGEKRTHFVAQLQLVRRESQASQPFLAQN